MLNDKIWFLTLIPLFKNGSRVSDTIIIIIIIIRNLYSATVRRLQRRWQTHFYLRCSWSEFQPHNPLFFVRRYYVCCTGCKLTCSQELRIENVMLTLAYSQKCYRGCSSGGVVYWCNACLGRHYSRQQYLHPSRPSGEKKAARHNVFLVYLLTLYMTACTFLPKYMHTGS